MGPHEPYWRTNTSFSPPPPRWDFRHQSEGLPYGSQDIMQPYGSSTSSNSNKSRSWVRSSHLTNHQFSTSDSAGPYVNSPSDTSLVHQWTPPAIQGINIDEYEGSARRDPVSGPLCFTPTMEGTSGVPDSGGSTSSCSDGSEYEKMARSHVSTHRSFPSRRSFMSKPIHPLSFPACTPPREPFDSPVTGLPDFDASTLQRDTHCWSSGSSSIDFTDVSESLDSESFGRSCNPPESFRCGLCDRLLSQRSPWSSRRIVRSGDMPVAGVLSCCHVFHAECLEQTTPKTRTNDPPCPICVKSEEEPSPEQRAFTKLSSSFPKLKHLRDDGPSRPWGCAHVGDCVEGALHAPSRNSMLILNRNRIKKNLSMKGSSSKEFPGKLKRIASYSPQVMSGKSPDQGILSCSQAARCSNLK
ncbi:hypothetical protein RJ641_003043 [Dillenia turbinata]|uniref:RING-type domain-containing protein n=1 Tax=Dillenia turbinata TaxID=194707 RepID=A0AAN8VBX5_9MAGN